MNERLRELMLEAGYAAPELAGRAKVLAALLVKDCMDIVKPTSHHEVWVKEQNILEEYKKPQYYIVKENY